MPPFDFEPQEFSVTASADDASAPAAALTGLIRELDGFVAANGWDQPTRLFAIAHTSDLLAHEPGLAETVATGLTPWTTIEQEQLPPHEDLDDLLRQIRWPDAVAGAAVSAERVMVSAAAAQDLPTDPMAAKRAAQEHAEAHELRVTMGVLRSGARSTVIRLRQYDDDDSVIVGTDLITGLGDLLRATFDD